VFGRNPRVVTGIDVGASSVKAVRLSHKGRTPVLVGAAVADLATGDDAPEDRQAALSRAVRSVYEEVGGTPQDTVVASVGGSSISVKHVVFPKMSKQALAESIHWEARKHVPFGDSDFVLDFQIMDGSNGENGQMSVLLAAVETKAVDQLLKRLGEVGIEPDTIDVAPLALMNEADEEGLIDGETVALVDIGATMLTLAVYRRGGLFFTRSVPLGRDVSDAGPRRSTVPTDASWTERVLNEVRRSLNYYNNETGKKGIERIYLAGGRALGDGLRQSFQDKTGIATNVLDPLSKVETSAVDLGDLTSQGPRLTVVMGLARRV
jgi:type IV pilus assembly protein PilM